MISKERLNGLAIKAASEVGIYSYMAGDFAGDSWQLEAFAHALLKAVEAESEVVGYRSADGHNCSTRWYDNHARECDQDDFTAKLIALPLVEGD